MYGTRAAADGGQQEYSGFLRSIGFTQGLACPCLFSFPSRRLYVSVHGDDFTTAGPKLEIDWFESLLEKKYELKKGGRLGPGDSDCKELTILNRVIRWTPSGVEYEANPRQGERLLESLALDGDGCKGVATPGQKLDISLLTSSFRMMSIPCSVLSRPGQIISRKTVLTCSLPRRRSAASCPRRRRPHSLP